MYEFTKKLEDLFLEDELFIDEHGYRCSVDGPIHRICYYKEFPGTDPSWQVHHIDCNELNNKLDNLVALPPPVHLKVHREIRRTGRIITRPEMKPYIDQYYSILKMTSELRSRIGNSKKAEVVITKYKNDLLYKSGFLKSPKKAKKDNENKKQFKKTNKARRKYKESIPSFT